jgi:hypothetical protein
MEIDPSGIFSNKPMNLPVAFLLLLTACHFEGVHTKPVVDIDKTNNPDPELTKVSFPQNSWEHYLQHLPYEKKPVVDYKGNEIANQQKHFAVLNFDIGNQDLQQCADALMRLRAEYLFSQNRSNEIAFSFTNGIRYSFNQFCEGEVPKNNGNSVTLIKKEAKQRNYASLRKYLNLVYMYAGTISLNNELKQAEDFGVGIIIIKPGSPGHCMIIIDEARDKKGNRYFRLAEGYTPAQSIYILRNTDSALPDPWYSLNRREIETTSYKFDRFHLRKFE